MTYGVHTYDQLLLLGAICVTATLLLVGFLAIQA